MSQTTDESISGGQHNGPDTSNDEPPLVRRTMRFGYGADTPAIWTPDKPEFSWAANSLSLMMPHIEPYFVQSMRQALPDLPPEQHERVRNYMAQESAHQGQHKLFNRILCTHYPQLKPVDKKLAQLFEGLEHRSQSFNLAFTAASETIAYAIARWAAKRRLELFSQADERVANMFLWHLAEEVEHKTVAFDVEQELGGGRLRYIQGLIASILIWASFVLVGILIMGWVDRRLHYPISWFRLTKWAITFSFELLTASVLSALPTYNPRNLADPVWYDVWMRDYEFAHSEPVLPDESSIPTSL